MRRIAVAAQSASAAGSRRGLARCTAPAVLAIAMAAVIAVVVTAPGGPGQRPVAATAVPPAGPGVPPYWIVHPGDTLLKIAAKTGLTVAQLETFNPQVDPLSLETGRRLNLWAHPPKPRPKPPGPVFWTVRPGQSFGSIAASTGINIIKLEHLNAQLKPSTLQPGQRVRLRPGEVNVASGAAGR